VKIDGKFRQDHQEKKTKITGEKSINNNFDEFPVYSQGKSKGFLDFNKKFRSHYMNQQKSSFEDKNYNHNGGRGFNRATQEKLKKEKLNIVKIKMKTDDITQDEIEYQKLVFYDGPEKRGFKHVNKIEGERQRKLMNQRVNIGRNSNLQLAGLVSSGHSKNDYKKNMVKFDNALDKIDSYNEFEDLDPVLENQYYSKSV